MQSIPRLHDGRGFPQSRRLQGLRHPSRDRRLPGGQGCPPHSQAGRPTLHPEACSRGIQRRDRHSKWHSGRLGWVSHRFDPAECESVRGNGHGNRQHRRSKRHVSGSRRQTPLFNRQSPRSDRQQRHSNRQLTHSRRGGYPLDTGIHPTRSGNHGTKSGNNAARSGVHARCDGVGTHSIPATTPLKVASLPLPMGSLPHPDRQ